MSFLVRKQAGVTPVHAKTLLNASGVTTQDIRSPHGTVSLGNSFIVNLSRPALMQSNARGSSKLVPAVAGSMSSLVSAVA